MSNFREQPDKGERQILYNQAHGLCPKCQRPLQYGRGVDEREIFQAAHIYSLNPHVNEIRELEKEERISDDVNALENFIPLCPNCHWEFDHPKTAAKYREILDLRKKMLDEASNRGKYHKYEIEDEIRDIVRSLVAGAEPENLLELNYNALHVREKLPGKFDHALLFQIESNVKSFYRYVAKELECAENANPGTSELVASQMKTAYLDFAKDSYFCESVFEALTDWIAKKTGGGHSKAAAGIVVSYFIQECEVFSRVTK